MRKTKIKKSRAENSTIAKESQKDLGGQNEQPSANQLREENRRLAQQLEALQHNLERLLTIYFESPVGIELFDRQGELLESNPASDRIFGIDGLGETGEVNLFKNVDMPAALIKALKRGESVRYHKTIDFDAYRSKNIILTRTGVAEIEVAVTPIYDQQKSQVQGYLALIEDITERKKTERALKARHIEYKFLAEASEKLLAMTTAEEVFSFLGKAIAGMLPETIILVNLASAGGEYLEIISIHGIERTLFQRAIDFLGFDPVGKRYRIHKEFRRRYEEIKLYRHANGLEELSGNILPPGAALKIQQMMGIHETYTIGIADRSINFGSLHIFTKNPGLEINQPLIESFIHQCSLAIAKTQTYHALVESEAKYRLLVENQTDVVIKTDTEGRIQYASPSFCDLFGRSEAELRDQKLHLLLHIDDRDTLARAIQATHEQPYHSYIEGRHLTKTGWRWLSWSNKALLDKEGRVDAILGVGRDITQRKQTEEKLRAKTEELDHFFTSNLDLLCIAGLDGYFHRLNPEWEKTLGYTLAELKERPFLDFVHPDDLEVTLKAVGDLAQSKEITGFVNRYRCKDGSYRWLEWRSYPVGNLIHASAHDITERIAIQAAEHEQRRLAEAVSEISLTLNSSLNPEEVLDTILQKVHDLVPYDAANIMLIEEGSAHIVRARGYDRYGTQKLTLAKNFDLQSVSHLGEMAQRGEFLLIPDVTQFESWRHLPETSWIQCYLGLPIRSRSNVFGILNLDNAQKNSFSAAQAKYLQVIADQAGTAMVNARLFSEVQYLATVDDLTGIYNRRGLFDLGQREVERARRFNRSLCALFMDIDHFKEFNDRCGYAVGDQVLFTLAAHIRSSLREVDLIGRYGGDEFVVLLPETDLDYAQKIAERLRDQVATIHIEAGKAELGITISIGICQLEDENENLNSLLERAGQALQRAKESGRNCFVAA